MTGGGVGIGVRAGGVGAGVTMRFIVVMLGVLCLGKCGLKVLNLLVPIGAFMAPIPILTGFP